MKTIRKKVLKEKLENELFKYERRIQKMAENAYKIRQALEQIYIQEKDSGPQQLEQEVHQDVQGETNTDVHERSATGVGTGSEAPAV